MVKKTVTTGEYTPDKLDNGSITVYRVYDNIKGVLREIIEQEGFEYDNDWITRQFGFKLISFLEDGEDQHGASVVIYQYIRQQKKQTYIMNRGHYRKKIINLRVSIAREREQKKRDNEYYASRIRSASSPSSKASYRKNKIGKSTYHNRKIENCKSQIESVKASLKRYK